MILTRDASHSGLFFRVPAVPARLPLARHRVRDFLLARGVAEDATDDVVLALDEALTNAVLYGGKAGPVEVRLSFEGDDLHLQVRDHGPGFDLASFDPAHDPEPSQSGGRGLHVMSRVMDEMSLELDGGLRVRMTKRATSGGDGQALPAMGFWRRRLLQIMTSRVREHRLRVLVAACAVEAAFLVAIGGAETRQVFGMPGSLVALTVVIAGALAGPLIGVIAAGFGGLMFYLTAADFGKEASPLAMLVSTAIWIAAAVVSGLLADALEAQSERRRMAAVELARAVAREEAQLAEQERISRLAADLDAERAQLGMIIEQIDSSVVFLDREFNFVLVNSAYARTCGFEPDEMVGLNHFQLYPDEENEAIFCRVRECGEPTEYVAKPFVFPDQPERGVTYWDWRLSPIKNDAAEVKGLVFSLVEVTQRVRAQQFSDALNEINRVANGRLEPLHTIEEALRLTGDALRCEKGALVSYQDEHLVVTHQWNMAEAQRHRFDVNELPSVALVLREMRPRAFLQSGDRRWDDPLWPESSGARIGIPLSLGREKLGVLVFHGKEPRGLDQSEEDFAVKVGAIVSRALENIRLFEEQRALALTLQEHLMHPLPFVEGVALGQVSMAAEAPALVGGDFSGVRVLDDARILVFTGDVTGKGVQAAGMTETVRTAIETLALVDPSPEYILDGANDLLLSYGADHTRFTTVFLAVIDRRTGAMRYASAGHPPPVLVGGGPSSFVEAPAGLPLGALPLDHQAAELTLRPGQTLVLYTDGVTEARRDGDQFGEERLLALLDEMDDCSPDAVAQRVSEAAATFAGGLSDDLQILVVRMLGNGSGAMR